MGDVNWGVKYVDAGRGVLKWFPIYNSAEFGAYQESVDKYDNIVLVPLNYESSYRVCWVCLNSQILICILHIFLKQIKVCGQKN